MNAAPRVGIILQARMGSTRLPGKVLKPLLGKPMLLWIVQRLASVSNASEVCVATSGLPENQILSDFLGDNGIVSFRGSESDVLDRYYQCAKSRGYDHVVRATGDNPFVDPEAAEELINLHFSQGAAYCNAFPEQGSGFPRGTGLEIFSFSALEECWKVGHEPQHREHVNEYILENLERFKHCVLKAPPNKQAPQLSLTVDLPEEFAFAEKLYQAYFEDTGRTDVPLQWVVERLQK